MADKVPDSAVVPTALAYTLGGDPGVRNPELAERYRNEYKTRGEKFALDYEDVMSKRQAEVENAKRILDETAAALRAGHTGEGPGQMNLPLLQMAAGFFKPTRSGNFGEEFGNALSGLAGGIGNQRMRDDEFNRGMADLTLKRSSFEQEPLKDRAALLKAQQLQQEKGQQAIEVAQMKTSPTQGMSPLAKLRRDRDQKLISEEEYQSLLAKMTHVGSSGGNAPREEKLYDRAKADWRKVNPTAPESDFPSLEGFMAEQKGRAAHATETGKSMAEAEMNLPKVLADAQQLGAKVDLILSDDNKKHLPGITGENWGMLPEWSIRDTNARRVLGLIKELQSQQFGDAVSNMRGLGALSNQEGAKIQDLSGRLDRRMSTTDFEDVLRRIKESISIINSETTRQQIELGKKSTGAGRDAGAAPTPAPGGAGATPPLPSGWEIVDGPNGPVYRQKRGP